MMHSQSHSLDHSANKPMEQVKYPAGNVVAVIDSAEAVAAASNALSHGGFLESEITVNSGPDAARAIAASTGHTGLAKFVMNVANRLHVKDEEMELKEQYTEALQSGKFVIMVLAPTSERKQLAVDVLKRHGAHDLNFYGRFTIETMDRTGRA